VRIKTISQFFSFCYGEIRDTYLAKLSPVYHTEYENLILSGQMKSEAGEVRDYFFFSGVHDKDFPWGDEELGPDLNRQLYHHFCLENDQLQRGPR
jgi:hypothetical protein